MNRPNSEITGDELGSFSSVANLVTDRRDVPALVLDDVTHGEAAQILGISEGTVSWRVSQAKDRLKAMKELDQ